VRQHCNKTLDNSNSTLAQLDQVESICRYVEKLSRNCFFGQVLLKFESGKVVHITETTSFKIETLDTVIK